MFFLGKFAIKLFKSFFRKILFLAVFLVLGLYIYSNGLPFNTYIEDNAATKGLSLLSAAVSTSSKTADDEAATERTKVTVTRVVDGDTFKCTLDKKTLAVNKNTPTLTIRIIGVDCPESLSPDAKKNCKEGKIASAYSKKMLQGKTVYLEYDVGKTDKYGRQLSYVYLSNGTMYNNQLLAEGMAKLMTIPPNVKYVDVFKKTQEEARKAKKGFWKSVW